MIYLYAVTDRPVAPLVINGLDSVPVESMACGELHIAYSAHEPGFEPEVAPASLWAHEAVVDTLLEAGPVIPFRFGTAVVDREAALALVGQEAGVFADLISTTRGRVELAVRIELPEDARVPRDGRAYLASRAVPVELLASLEEMSEASKRSRDATVVRASYLVNSEDVAEFVGRVRALQSRRPDVVITCTGPWAPYSFVGELAA